MGKGGSSDHDHYASSSSVLKRFLRGHLPAPLALVAMLSLFLLGLVLGAASGNRVILIRPPKSRGLPVVDASHQVRPEPAGG